MYCKQTRQEKNGRELPILEEQRLNSCTKLRKRKLTNALLFIILLEDVELQWKREKEIMTTFVYTKLNAVG